MSTSPATETTQPPRQDNPSSEPNIGSMVTSNSPGSQLAATEQNISEQTATTTNEHNDSTKSQEVSLNIQPESKVTSTENIESKTPLAECSKMPEENKIDNVENNVQQSKTEVQETPEDKPSIANTAQTINDPTPSNEKTEADKGKNTENGEAEKLTMHHEEPSVVNENTTQRNPVPENQQDDDRDTSECVNIQELTEHVMNILNDDGVVESAMSEKQLLQKNVDLQQFIVKLIHLLKEKTDLCANLDRQNSALISQAKSLKDVIAITKDLLGIRNMEIEHLHADMAAMEDSIKEERNRHNLSVQRLNEAMTLNDKLKTEYLTQMDLFQKLREKYNEKVVYLTRENQRLNGLMNPDAQAAEGNTNETNDQTNQVESVDK